MKTEAIRLTRIDSIDRDHHSLLETLHFLQNENITQSDLEENYQKLRRYAALHFDSEEKILLETGYPKLEQHKKMHQHFRDKVEILGSTILGEGERADSKVDQMVNEAKEALGKTVMAKASPRVMMVAFLVQWLLQHVNGRDQDYVAYLKMIKTDLGALH
jgi:hemerythrin-like metal-binding protein